MNEAIRFLEKRSEFIDNSSTEYVTIEEAIQAVRIGVIEQLEIMKKLYHNNKLDSIRIDNIINKIKTPTNCD